jgi:hypothetical protein
MSICVGNPPSHVRTVSHVVSFDTKKDVEMFVDFLDISNLKANLRSLNKGFIILGLERVNPIGISEFISHCEVNSRLLDVLPYSAKEQSSQVNVKNSYEAVLS